MVVPFYIQLTNILRQTDMVTTDGIPLVRASRWLGSPLPMRVAGSDLVPKPAEAAVEVGSYFYFWRQNIRQMLRMTDLERLGCLSFCRMYPGLQNSSAMYAVRGHRESKRGTGKAFSSR